VSQGRPSLAEILHTVAEFLDGLRPKLEGEAHYGALVPAHILRVGEREVMLSTPLDARGPEGARRVARALGFACGPEPDTLREHPRRTIRRRLDARL
jgi:hypothetical protein